MMGLSLSGEARLALDLLRCLWRSANYGSRFELCLDTRPESVVWLCLWPVGLAGTAVVRATLALRPVYARACVNPCKTHIL